LEGTLKEFDSGLGNQEKKQEKNIEKKLSRQTKDGDVLRCRGRRKGRENPGGGGFKDGGARLKKKKKKQFGKREGFLVRRLKTAESEKNIQRGGRKKSLVGGRGERLGATHSAAGTHTPYRKNQEKSPEVSRKTPCQLGKGANNDITAKT